MTASKPAENDTSVYLGFVILAVTLCSRAQTVLQSRLVGWTKRPLTVVGARFAAVAAARGGSALSRIAAGLVVLAANHLRPSAEWFAVSGLIVGLYPPAADRYGHFPGWPTEALVCASLFSAVAGIGAALATPLAWPFILQTLSLLIAAVNVLTAAVCALLAAERGGNNRILEHGPTFVSPVCDGPSVLVGRGNPAVLPGHARWLARRSGEIRIPFDRLSRGITILGEKGAGKSRLLFAIHDAIRAAYPKVPILIHDPKGEWYRTYYDPATDRYFAPHFMGSSNWRVWTDFHKIPMLRHALITAAIHAHPGSDTFWMDQAVDMLENAASHENFRDALLFLSSIPAARPDDRFLMSVFGSARLGFLDIAKAHLMGGDGPGLSIDEYLNFSGRILLLNDPSCADQQRGVFSLFLTAFLLRALSMPDVREGELRAVAIIDEALTFHLPPDVDRRIYALCRSKGLCIIAGAQRLPDRNNGERGEWQNSEYTFAMKVIHQDSQVALSKRAGTLLFRQKKETKSTHESGSSTSASEQDSRQDAIPPEHFGRLDPRKFVLFHDRGMITGQTVDVHREQHNTRLPTFDSLTNLTKISHQLTAGGKHNEH